MESNLSEKTTKDIRISVRTYIDFLDNSFLTMEEQMIYIVIKSFIDVNADEGVAYPSIETICRRAKVSKQRAIKNINSLVKKGILTKKRNGLSKNNSYGIVDDERFWACENLEELKEVTKNKVPVLSAPPKVTDKTDTQLTQEKYSLENRKSQEVEQKYPLEWLKNHYEYEQMVEECPEEQETIDNVIQILYEDMNASAKTIRVGKENKPKEAYISKMMKLTSKGILYAIKKYKEAKEPIGNTTNYMRTLLYRAEEQRHLDNLNKQSIQSNQYNNDQGGSLLFDMDKPMHMTKSAEAYNNYSQRQHSQEYWDDLEQQLLALAVPT